MMNHDYCRECLRLARQQAMNKGAKPPLQILAQRAATGPQENWTVTARNMREEVKACCQFDARAQAIDRWVAKKLEAGR